MSDNLKRALLAINHAYIFFMSSVYLGLFWSLHFFFFPSYVNLRPDNYYDQIIVQTETATHFFFIVIPPMILAIIIMLISEWRTRFRWVPVAWVFGLGIPIYVQQGLIEPVNNALKAHVTDPAQLKELLDRWVMLNNVRWSILTVMWLITMYYFFAKGNIWSTILPPRKP
jgi:hypothetical protein